MDVISHCVCWMLFFGGDSNGIDKIGCIVVSHYIETFLITQGE